jgi:hypothetical protein
MDIINYVSHVLFLLEQFFIKMKIEKIMIYYIWNNK